MMAIKLWTCRCCHKHGKENEGFACIKCKTEVINISAIPPKWHKKLKRSEIDKLLRIEHGKKIFKSSTFSVNCGMSIIISIFV